MHNSSVQSSSWNAMTRSSSICKALPVGRSDAAHEKDHYKTTTAEKKQQSHKGKHFKIHRSLKSERVGREKYGKNMKHHENCFIKFDPTSFCC